MSISVATKINFQQALDKKVLAGLTSAPMEMNASQVQYSSGKEFKIPKMATDGLADYARNGGYVSGEYAFEYQTKTFKKDRGRSFPIDVMDIDETGFVLTAGALASTFIDEKVVPEIDSFRYSEIFSIVNTAGDYTEAYTPAKETVFGKFKDALTAVGNETGGVPLVAFVNALVLGTLEKSSEFTRIVTSEEVQREERKTKVRMIDGVQLIPVPSSRMKTVYNFLTGGTGQEAGGVTAGTNAMDINWIICPMTGPIAIVKHAMPKIISPENNTDADGYIYGYRVYHTLEIADNKIPLFRVSYTPIAAPALTATVAKGTGTGNTKFTATAGTGNTLAYILGAATAGVKYNDLLSKYATAVEPYTSAADIAAAEGQYLTMLKVNALGRIIEAKEVVLASGDISTGT
ncbi:MAG: hypothetical protein VB025_07500 [Sphaerochaeta sp.]|nr:hypothetical protein [Sphaerochaeta sp.]